MSRQLQELFEEARTANIIGIAGTVTRQAKSNFSRTYGPLISFVIADNHVLMKIQNTHFVFNYLLVTNQRKTLKK